MSLTPSTELSQPRIMHLHIINNSIYINNIQVISKYSVACLDIMHVLLAQFWQDFKNGLPAEKYKFLNINQLGERLGFNSEIHNLEYKIRRPLNRMIKAIKENLFEKLGIDCNDIIENVGWPGYSCKDHGYRLNPFILSLGAAKSTERSLSCL
ncbi:hypothetical protein [Wolbachia endosymbiont (group A) of Andrena hattorfiana]|uniref:hypothetical protein n=1 Tax=Wolbachia endosymbiont (group A) of Andrena hattorfiana TaxID=2953977 RepID=UPI0021F85136|nr:hypothetical protein [Wolbachia endosymbiont (group A) of Andrena hattorfiana]